MAEYPDDIHQYATLSTHTSFRIFDLLPGADGDPISCVLRHVDWDDAPEYEAMSYAWGDPTARAPIIVDGNRLDVTVNLHTGLRHLRFKERTRVLWVDAIW